MTTTKTINLRTIRKIANKYDLSWYAQGGGWIINGIQQHYSYTADNAGEKAALVDYIANWGQHCMSDDDFGTIREAQAQLQSR